LGKPKLEGGLGVLELKNFNKVLFGKVEMAVRIREKRFVKRNFRIKIWFLEKPK